VNGFGFGQLSPAGSTPSITLAAGAQKAAHLLADVAGDAGVAELAAPVIPIAADAIINSVAATATDLTLHSLNTL
jgi:hypothetical protein